VRSILFCAALLCVPAFAAPAKPKPKSTSTKVATPAKKPSSTRPAEEGREQMDKNCRRDLAWGKLDALRARCGDLAPAGSAEATYWRLALSDDPNELRRGFAPGALAKIDPDPRLLLLAGRYHFARGQIREMEDLVELGRKARLKGPEIDTLKRLAAGK
jgi:hypothetical protein